MKCFLLGETNGVTARASVEMQLAELKRRLGAGVLPMGASWGGSRIRVFARTTNAGLLDPSQIGRRAMRLLLGGIETDEPFIAT